MSKPCADRVALPGKLVRDNIPDIIKNSGQIPIIDKVTVDNRAEYIHMKLIEECDEYIASGDMEELADIIEVCFTAAAWQGLNMLDLLIIAYKKRLEQGGFQEGVLWMGNEERDDPNGVAW